MKQPSPRQRDALALDADGKFYPDLIQKGLTLLPKWSLGFYTGDT